MSISPIEHDRVEPPVSLTRRIDPGILRDRLVPAQKPRRPHLAARILAAAKTIGLVLFLLGATMGFTTWQGVRLLDSLVGATQDTRPAAPMAGIQTKSRLDRFVEAIRPPQEQIDALLDSANEGLAGMREEAKREALMARWAREGKFQER